MLESKTTIDCHLYNRVKEYFNTLQNLALFHIYMASTANSGTYIYFRNVIETNMDDISQVEYASYAVGIKNDILAIAGRLDRYKYYMKLFYDASLDMDMIKKFADEYNSRAVVEMI